MMLGPSHGYMEQVDLSSSWISWHFRPLGLSFSAFILGGRDVTMDLGLEVADSDNIV